MKNIFKITLATGLALAMSACNLGEFDDDVTVNPNLVTLPYAGNLLTGALLSFPGTIASSQAEHYVQHLANSQYTTSDQYDTDQFDFSGFYAGRLADLERIKLVNSDPETAGDALQYGLNENQLAVANILQAYWYQHITDRWGPIPFSQALKGLEGSTELPAFDTQESIYNTLFTNLSSAVASITGSSDPDLGKYDILFGGNMDKWKQFANTLRMTMALRISQVDPAKGSAEFNAAINAGVITSDVYAEHPADINYENPWYSAFRSRKDHCIANTLVIHMQPAAYQDLHTGANGVLDTEMDPRLPIYGDPAEATGTYDGVPYGIENSADVTGGNSYVSFLGTAMREQTQPTYIYTMAQVHFSMAEASLLGWISDDANTHYLAGIKASMDQYGIAEADYDSYITNTWVAPSGTVTWEQVMNQKWLANFLHGWEAWADWRRTGFPTLTPAEQALNFDEGGQIPVRHGFGNNTIDLNGDNYNAMVSSQLGGSDRMDVPVWWDK